MSGYGFGKRPTSGPAGGAGEDRLDLSGIARAPVAVDPSREEAAIQRGAALGFIDRGAAEPTAREPAGRRRRATQPQISVFIKGPQDTLEWFIEYTNQRGNRSYWQTLEEFRALVERK
ncbi:hypothetical protein PX554_22735 [Sphingomonas sp. H39-1-10]|uniref:hypothetical protein n=1 Tax=Sphingomonas pollutisoli TaxID=3030829 RepID=UPI0023B8D538|nr:hypothetical protein [Sphingomonas pollutisoli]MDF0490946.1 hypothetical protein [Sphingomonas pollutisoli]